MRNKKITARKSTSPISAVYFPDVPPRPGTIESPRRSMTRTRVTARKSTGGLAPRRYATAARRLPVAQYLNAGSMVGQGSLPLRSGDNFATIEIDRGDGNTVTAATATSGSGRNDNNDTLEPSSTLSTSPMDIAPPTGATQNTQQNIEERAVDSVSSSTEAVHTHGHGQQRQQESSSGTRTEMTHPVPGHSRCPVYGLTATATMANPNRRDSDGASDTISSAAKPKRKKKFPTLKEPFIPSVGDSSQSQAPNSDPSAVAVASNTSATKSTAVTKDKRVVKKAFRHFQSIRQLLTDTKVASHINDFGHLNAVENLLITCYNRVKENTLTVVSVPPQALEEGTSTGTSGSKPNSPNKRTSEIRETSISLAVQTDPTPIPIPPKNSSKKSPGPKSRIVEPNNSNNKIKIKVEKGAEQEAPDPDIPCTSSGVARKQASVTPPSVELLNEYKKSGWAICSWYGGPHRTVGGHRCTPLGFQKWLEHKKSDTSVTQQSGSVDETINEVVRGGRVNTSSSSNATTETQTRHGEVLNQLLNMGFHGQFPMSYLKQIVEDSNGRLEACVDKLTS